MALFFNEEEEQPLSYTERFLNRQPVEQEEEQQPLSYRERYGTPSYSDRYGGRTVPGPSTLEASFPMAAERKGKGIQETSETLKRLTGFELPLAEETGKAIEEYGTAGLEGYRPEYIDKNLVDLPAEDVIPWLGETIESQAGEMGINYGLSYLSNKIGGVPGTVIRGLNTGQIYTGLVAEAQEDIARKSGLKSVDELTDTQKTKAQFIAGANTFLELWAPRNLGKTDKKYKFTGDNKKDADTWQDISKEIKRNKSEVAKEFAKETFKVGASEAATEYLQGVTTSLAAESGIGYELTPQGIKEAFDRVVGGFAGGSVYSSPATYRQATLPNRQIDLAQQVLRAQNIQNKLEAGKVYREQGIDYAPFQFDVPDKKVGKTRQTIADIGKLLFNRSISQQGNDFERAINRASTGSDVDLIVKDIAGAFVGAESFSGQEQVSPGYHKLRKQYLGKYAPRYDKIMRKWSRGIPLTGRMFESVDPDVDAYITARLLGKPTEQLSQVLSNKGIDIADLNNDINTINNIKNELYEDLSTTLGKSGLGLGYQKNYIPRSINREAVERDTEGFITSVIEDVGGYTREQAQEIANDIINGRDPATLSSEQIRNPDIAKKKGKDKEGFEKSRSKKWDKLNEDFRETSALRSIENYITNATNRLASAEAFGGKNAEKLSKAVNRALERGLIDNNTAKRIWGLYDAEHRRLGTGTEYENILNMTRTASQLAAVKLLGLATLSSLPELAWMPGRVGFVNMLKASPKAAGFFLKGLAQTILPGGTGKAFDNAFAKTLLQTLGMATNPVVMEKIEALIGGDINKYMSMWFRAPAGLFLTQYTNFVRAWTAVSALEMLQNEANKVHRGKKLTAKNKRALERELRENGLTFEDFKEMVRRGNGKLDVLNDQYLEQRFTKSNGNEISIRDAIVPWLEKIVTDVALEPQATNRPLWTSDKRFQAVAQLKSFPIVFGNTILKRTYKQLNPKICTPGLQNNMSVLFSVGAAFGLASLVVELKKFIKGNTDESTISEYIAGMGIPYWGTDSLVKAGGLPVLSTLDMFFKPMISMFTDDDGNPIADTAEALLDILVRTFGSAIFAEQLGE